MQSHMQWFCHRSGSELLNYSDIYWPWRVFSMRTRSMGFGLFLPLHWLGAHPSAFPLLAGDWISALRNLGKLWTELQQREGSVSREISLLCHGTCAFSTFHPSSSTEYSLAVFSSPPLLRIECRTLYRQDNSSMIELHPGLYHKILLKDMENL